MKEALKIREIEEKIKSIAELEAEGVIGCAEHLKHELRHDLKETKKINLTKTRVSLDEFDD